MADTNIHDRNAGVWPSVLRFTAIAWGITWLLWLPLVLARCGVDMPEWVRYCHYLGGLGPALSAFIVARSERERGTGGCLREALSTRRPGIVFVLIGIFGPILLFALAAVITGLAGEGWPDPAGLGTTAEYPMLGHAAYWIVTMIFFGWGEEIGWRGFALPRLQSRYSPLVAAVIVSVIWSLWHVPAFFYNENYGAMGSGGTAGWYFSMLTGSIILTWLFNASRGSILVVALFHATLDITINSPGPASLAMTMGVLITIAGMMVLVLTRSRLRPSERNPVRW